MSVRPSGRALWVFSTALGFITFTLASAFLGTNPPRITAALVVAVVLFFVAIGRMEGDLLAKDSSQRITQLETLARVELGRWVNVLPTEEETARCRGANVLYVPRSTLGTKEGFAAFAHELSHLKSRDPQRRLPALLGGGVLLPNLILLQGTGPVLLLAAFSAAFFLEVLVNGALELKADVFAVRWGLASGRFSREDYIQRRRRASMGMGLTHPPRWLRVWVAQIV